MVLYINYQPGLLLRELFAVLLNNNVSETRACGALTEIISAHPCCHGLRPPFKTYITRLL